MVLPQLGLVLGLIELVAEQLRPTLLGRLSFRMFAVNGGLMSYGINAIDQFPRARHVEAKRSWGPCGRAVRLRPSRPAPPADQVAQPPQEDQPDRFPPYPLWALVDQQVLRAQ